MYSFVFFVFKLQVPGLMLVDKRGFLMLTEIKVNNPRILLEICEKVVAIWNGVCVRL